MRRTQRPALAVLIGVAVAVAASSAGCEKILPWTDDGGAGDAGDGGDGEDAGDSGYDAGNLGDGGSGAWLESFGPTGQFLRAPADGGRTTPLTLLVTVRRDGESGDIQVNIDSSDASVASVAGGVLTIPMSFNFAPVPISSSAAGTATLTATFDGGMLSATVTVLPTVVLSEVAIANGLADMDEFVELHNPTAVDFSLAGYVLQYHSDTAGTPYLNICTLGAIEHIKPHGYYLVGVNDYARGQDTHSTWAGAGSFSGSAGTVRLAMPGTGTSPDGGLVVDAVGWGTTAVSPEGTPAGAPSTLGSLERKAKSTSSAGSMSGVGADRLLGNGYDTNNNASDFVLQTLQDPQTSTSATEP